MQRAIAKIMERKSKCNKNLNDSSDKILQSIPFNLGGGGALDLLYFLTRYSKPKIVLETGVVAGHSSKTILTAIGKNGEGHLYSSDFPYFRLKSQKNLSVCWLMIPSNRNGHSIFVVTSLQYPISVRSYALLSFFIMIVINHIRVDLLCGI